MKFVFAAIDWVNQAVSKPIELFDACLRRVPDPLGALVKGIDERAGSNPIAKRLLILELLLIPWLVLITSVLIAICVRDGVKRHWPEGVIILWVDATAVAAFLNRKAMRYDRLSHWQRLKLAQLAVVRWARDVWDHRSAPDDPWEPKKPCGCPKDSPCDHRAW